MRVRLPLGYIKMGIGLVRSLYWRVGGIVYFRLQLMRLAAERTKASPAGQQEPVRVIASAGWYFPIYSHTFVYQELTQLLAAGFRVKFFYGAIKQGDHLPAQFEPLSQAKDRLVFHPVVCRRSVRYFARRSPERFEALLRQIEAQSGLSRAQLLAHEHVGQAFAFARLVDAYRPHYLHSYFFYQDALYALVASSLLDIPRGVSCYADHMLADYDLKMVPLHLRQASVMIATSRRIKSELLSIEPSTPESRILVKVNAINARHFPLVARERPSATEPFRLVSVCRIEPKKGLPYQVDAVDMLRRRGVPVEWTIVGGVDDNESSRACHAELLAKIASLGLDPCVFMPGKQSEEQINAIFARAHVFVAPFVETDSGDKDGVPTALLEGMASGLAVVATDAGSIPEVIEHGGNGVLVPQRDSGALADAIQSLAVDHARRETLGAAGAATVRERFDVRVCDHVFHDRLRRLLSVSAPVAVVDSQAAS